MKQRLLVVVRFITRLFPFRVIEFLYVNIFGRWPLRLVTQAILRRLIPDQLRLTTGAHVALDPTDVVVSGALTLGCYENFSQHVFNSVLKPGMTVVDVGANIGLYTAIAAAVVGPSGRVIAFEPDPQSFSILEKTVQLNSFRNVTCVPQALSCVEGEMSLHYSTSNHGDHRLYPVSGSDRRVIPVLVTTLDTFLKKQPGDVAVVKIDVQGMEGFVLEGMKAALQSSIRYLFVELWPDGIRQSGYDPYRLLSSLRGTEFSIYSLNESRHCLEKVLDDVVFLSRYRGRGYTNLFCSRQSFPPDISIC